MDNSVRFSRGGEEIPEQQVIFPSKMALDNILKDLIYKYEVPEHLSLVIYDLLFQETIVGAPFYKSQVLLNPGEVEGLKYRLSTCLVIASGQSLAQVIELAKNAIRERSRGSVRLDKAIVAKEKFIYEGSTGLQGFSEETGIAYGKIRLFYHETLITEIAKILHINPMGLVLLLGSSKIDTMLLNDSVFLGVISNV